MGFFGDFGTSTQSSDTKSSSKPLAEQMPYLTQGWSAAGNSLNQAQGATKPTDFVSQFTPEQMDLYNRMMGYSNSGAAAGSTAAGGAATSTGANWLQNAYAQYAGFNPSTSQTIANANQYANDPSVSGRVDAAMMGAERAANEQYLPSIARNAAATGNRDSSKTAIQQGIIGRGLAETRAGIDANMRGDLYKTGLGLSQNQDQLSLASILGGASAGTNAMNSGVNATGAGVGQQGDIFNIGAAGSAGITQGNQAALNDAMARYQFGTSSPFDALNAYWNIVGSNNWGGTQVSHTDGTSTASDASVIGGLMGAAGSIVGGKK